jgi:hypothetical protein
VIETVFFFQILFIFKSVKLANRVDPLFRKKMAKEKKKKRQAEKFAPMGPETMDDVDQDIQAKIEKKQPSYPILKELKDLRPEMRQQACMSLSNMVFEEDETLSELISCGAINRVCQLLCDPVKSVRTSAAGKKN